MARAKRTARADARRRHRAELHQADAPIDSDAEAAGSTTSSGSRRAETKATDAAPTRMGIGTAFRLAFRPLDVRGDLASIPSVLLRSKALWIPLGLVVGSTVFLVAAGGRDIVSQFMFAYFIQTPAIGGVFLAGFLAPRASWLLGLVVGLASVICFAIVITLFPSTVAAVAPSEGEVQAAVTAALALSPVMGAFFASAAAWYRRFLQYTSPNRTRRAAGKPTRHDGRARSTGTQKAGARR